MIRSALFQQFESGNGLFFRSVRVAVLAGGVFALALMGVLELTWPQQIVLGLLTVALVVWLHHSSSSYLVTLTLMLASIFSTFRYGFWRLQTTERFFRAPGSVWSALDGFFIGLLLLAECYAFLILLLGYLQTLWPLRRAPVPLPDNLELWPAIDLLIPTYNEPLSVVKHTVLASLNIDWPADKLHIYLLDDGSREEFRRFAEDAGVGYMARESHEHAKAGNINAALAHLDAPYVAIFDCDHVPTRSFLQVTMGWFLRDSRLGMLQTPHHFYSPDPFERNLDQFGSIPNEGELFYGVVQDGNDFWNATFFCGSCAVLRRSALDEIGGIAVETVTEDAHTSLRIQRNGWNTAYLNIPQAAGLATERLSGHVRQRIRWARGMIQIMRIENPLFARGLTAAQRLCYFNAMTHFLYALPRLIFLTAPLIYLIFGHVNLPGFWLAIVAYAMPHLVLSNLTNSRIQGQHRHSFWNEIYETVLAPYLLLPTLLALVHPRFGSFEVTAKGGVVNRRFFDRRIAQPFLLMIAMNVVGMLCAIPRFFRFPGGDSGWPVNLLAGMYDGGHRGTIVMNLVWALFNTIILGVATSVAWESRQRRQTVRLAMTVPADVALANGSILHGVTTDLSSGGLMIRMERDFTATIGDGVKLTLPLLDGSTTLPGTLVGIEGKMMRAQFDPLTLQEEEALTIVLYSRADRWLGWDEARASDAPLVSLRRIVRLSLQGFLQAVRGSRRPRAIKPAKVELLSSVTPLLLLAMLAGMGGLSAEASGRPGLRRNSSLRLAAFVHRASAVSWQAAQPGMRTSADPSSGVQPFAVVGRTPFPGPPAAGAFDSVLALPDIGVSEAIVLRGSNSSRTVRFSLPRNQQVSNATLHLRYRLSPGTIPSQSPLRVSLNGKTLAPLPMVVEAGAPQADGAANVAGADKNAAFEATVVLPAEALASSNELTFDFVDPLLQKCEDSSQSMRWVEVDSSSTLEFAGVLRPLPDDLKLLPAPFYDAAVSRRPVIPIVFFDHPSAKALQAAGVVASWFGVLADAQPVRFPVSIGVIPAGNVIVIAESQASLPAELQSSLGPGSSVSMRANPSDPYSMVLVLAGDSGGDVLKAADALVLQGAPLAGSQVRVSEVKLPAPREADDAPRWLSTEKITPLADLPQPGSLETDGSEPVVVALRLPPDLCFGCVRQNLGLHLRYRYNGVPLANDSTLRVSVNDADVSVTPLPQTDKAAPLQDTVVPVPVSDLRTFSNAIRIRFGFLLASKGDCAKPARNDLHGMILKDSYLDLRGVPHWVTLPNLEIFANAGYPFTRRADLAETVVVMPERPSAEEIEMFATLMGHFGAQTGYPVLNVTVTNSDGMKADGRKDYLVLGTVDDQPAIGRLNGSLPVEIDGSGLHIRDTQGFQYPQSWFAPLEHAWWKVPSSDRIDPGALETAGGLPDALIEGTGWPNGSSRSVVLVALRDQSVVSNFLSVFLRVSQSSDVSQSVSVLHGSHFVSYRIGNDVYHVGSRPVWMEWNILFAQYQWLMAIVTLTVCFLLAVILRSALRKRARLRLQGAN